MWIGTQRSADRKLADLCGSELSVAEPENEREREREREGREERERVSPPPWGGERWEREGGREGEGVPSRVPQRSASFLSALR